MTDITNPNHPVILFVPEAGMYAFLRGLSVLGDAVVKKGGKVFVTFDNGVMLRSPMMSRKRMPAYITEEQIKSITESNEKNIRIVEKKYGFSVLKLSDFVDKNIKKEINDLIKNIDEDLYQITYKGFPVGEIAQYDFALETKSVYSKESSKEHKKLYAVYVKNTALAIAVTDRICKKLKPSLFLAFNEYAECQGMRYSAQKNDVRRMAITNPPHLNVDGSRLQIWDTLLEYWIFRHCANWPKFKDIPLKRETVNELWNDVVFHMYRSGSHIFSYKKNTEPSIIFDKLKLNPKRKTLVAYTSSPDEEVGLRLAMKIWDEDTNITEAFETQAEWMEYLKNYVEKRDDVQVVVRVHPREGPRQFGFDSDHLKFLKSKFLEDTEKFKIIWPENPISSYDLMELADICLVSCSNIGQEAARLGIPQLAYVGNMSYQDDDFMQVATTKEEYGKRLDSVINMELNWNQLLKAMRFCNWRNFVTSLNLRETVPIEINNDTIWPKAPESKIEIINNILSGKEDLVEYNIKAWKNSLTEKSKEIETEAMKKGIRRFLDQTFYPPLPEKKRVLTNFYIRIWNKLIGGNAPFSKHKQAPFIDYTLKYSNDSSKIKEFVMETEKNSNLRIILSSGMNSTLIHNGKIIERLSPMINRLSKLHERAN
jgi:hypothetical protein